MSKLYILLPGDNFYFIISFNEKTSALSRGGQQAGNIEALQTH